VTVAGPAEALALLFRRHPHQAPNR
jgi:hypothetical protein